MAEKYIDYFNIDPEYFPQVNEAIINKEPDLWKKFYPHESFVGLIRDTISVVTRKQKVSIWVEGAYGTGKSHAVLTLKKLLDASPEATKEYFDKYKDQLSGDLYNQFSQIKSGDKILTVHRYGSSNIKNDNSLVFAIQNSIIEALKDGGFSGMGQNSLRDSTVEWLSDEANKAYFNTLISKQYEDLFGGDNTDDIISKLNSYSGASLQEIMDKVMKVAEERQFKALSLDPDRLTEWINSVIRGNNLKALIFIWDEFTEYFRNNMRSLTGFQKLADLSSSSPFYFIIVTHDVENIFSANDKDFGKIKGRFIDPICRITLPDTMAFRLLGAAMEKKDDPVIRKEWNETVDDLYDRTHESRNLIKNKAHISDKELQSILPIHPYTALMLKDISAAFGSNQRSMFDFIKNDRGDDIKGFQWYIKNCGPYDENPLLTIDMLWEFFYENGKELLTPDIRAILDCYPRAAAHKLDRDENRVLKAVLLLQAISQRTGNTVELYIPNDKNLDNAFEGSNFGSSEASRIAHKLVKDQILFEKPLGAGKTCYSALTAITDTSAVEKFKPELRTRSTTSLVESGQVGNAIVLDGAMKLRYATQNCCASDIKRLANELRSTVSGNRIGLLTAYSKDDSESTQLFKAIKEVVNDSSYDVVIVDTSLSPLGKDLYDRYIDAMANAQYQRNKDNQQANQYEKLAGEALKEWRNKIGNGEFIVYTHDKPDGERVPDIKTLANTLHLISRKRYPYGLENGGSVNDTMWLSSSLAAGVDCGVTGNLSGLFRSANPQTNLLNYLECDVYTKEYWKEDPSLRISKIKKAVDDTIAADFKADGRISISKVYDALISEPFGFMPCNLTAFIMGVVLKEYASSAYSWSDGMTSEPMSTVKLKDMVSEIIKHHLTPIARYKEKYIVTMTAEEREFTASSAEIFGIDPAVCSSIEATRNKIRVQLKTLVFPIWCVKHVLPKLTLSTPQSVLEELIDLFGGIANSNNLSQHSTETDIALKIGRLCIDNKSASTDLKAVITRDNCASGMNAYINRFNGGELALLADEIGDNGRYMNRLKKKFDADDANWVWNKDTADLKIQEVILEYKIINESNRYLPKSIDFEGALNEWTDKCRNIKISYFYAINDWESVSPLMGMLFDIVKTGSLPDAKRQAFLDNITALGQKFIELYNDPLPLFSKVCSYILSKFSPDDIKEIYKSLPVNLFTTDKQEYQNTVKRKADEFASTQGSLRLKELWISKTDTGTPREWSDKYSMPILCMIPDGEYQEAKSVFDLLNSRRQNDPAMIDKAIEYLESATSIADLSNEEKRDNAFREKIIKGYDVLLDNIEEVKKHLRDSPRSEPYDWIGLSSIDRLLKEMAEFKYNESGCDKALEKIDDMDVADVKKYLKELIRSNMTVGMEIIKDN